VLRGSATPAAGQQDNNDSVEALQEHLLAAVSRPTGYPKEMLGLDRNMEADLGIDSIKKIEIFSELREHHAVLRVEDEERTLEELSGLRTLGSIIDWYRHNLEKKNQLTA
jgi:acyl carrier protein